MGNTDLSLPSWPCLLQSLGGAPPRQCHEERQPWPGHREDSRHPQGAGVRPLQAASGSRWVWRPQKDQLPDLDSWQGRPTVSPWASQPTSHQVPAAGVPGHCRSPLRCWAWPDAADPGSPWVPAALVTGMTVPWPVPAPAGQPLARDRTLGGTRIEELKDSYPLRMRPLPPLPRATGVLGERSAGGAGHRAGAAG